MGFCQDSNEDFDSSAVPAGEAKHNKQHALYKNKAVFH